MTRKIENKRLHIKKKLQLRKQKLHVQNTTISKKVKKKKTANLQNKKVIET